MKNILVPIGASVSAVNTLQYAIDLAEVLDANVYAISVFREFSRVGSMNKVNSLIKEDSKGELAAILDQVDKKDVTVVAHPIKGDYIEGVKRFNSHIPVDLMVMSPRSNDVSEEVYLGRTTGGLIKNTNIPSLIVPKDVSFKAPETILMAFKSGKFRKKSTIAGLKDFVVAFECKLNLLHVHTPNPEKDDDKVSGKLKSLSNTYIESENATTYQGVLEHFQSHNPDMLCVIRRKRGFFRKLWESDTVLKEHFYTTIPLLVLGVEE